MRFLVALFLVSVIVAEGNGALPDPYTVEDIINSRCSPTQACYPSSARINQLDQAMSGYITRQSNTVTYARQNLMYNRIEQRQTSMIAMVKSKEDIQKAVLFAREFNLHVTIKSTGHDYAGRSTWQDSFVIHLGLMKNIEVNPNATSRSQHGEIKTETGTNWEAVYRRLDNYDRTVVGGSAHTVGPGGYTLGGGHSPISKSLGYAVDNVLEMQVVLADGSIATCTHSQAVIEHVNGTSVTHDDGDLLWALRGGGGGTFGVTVYIIFKLHPQPSQMVVFSGLFPLIYENPTADAYNDVMTALSNFIVNSTRHWGGYWLLSSAPIIFDELRMRGSVFLYLNKFGSWDENTLIELSEFMALKDKYQLQGISLTNKTSFWDYEQNANDPDSSNSYLATSLLDKKNAKERLGSFFREELFTTWRDDPFSCTGILTGGKTMEQSADFAPVNPGYRSAVSFMSCGVDVSNDNKTALINKSKDFAYRLRTMGQGMYFNEAFIDSVYWREDFWGKENYGKLLQIKKRFDPNNFFTCYHCVNSDTTPYQGETTDGCPQMHANLLILLLAVFIAKLI